MAHNRLVSAQYGKQRFIDEKQRKVQKEKTGKIRKNGQARQRATQ